MRRRDLLKAMPALVAAPLATPALAQAQKPLRFIPQANLTVLDPIWTTAVITYNHAYMVYDKLYGWDGAQIRPQMVAGHDVSQDELTWTFTLRDGLKFHDNEPVRGVDCIASIARWAKRDGFGQRMAAQFDRKGDCQRGEGEKLGVVLLNLHRLGLVARVGRDRGTAVDVCVFFPANGGIYVPVRTV